MLLLSPLTNYAHRDLLSTVTQSSQSVVYHAPSIKSSQSVVYHAPSIIITSDRQYPYVMSQIKWESS